MTNRSDQSVFAVADDIGIRTVLAPGRRLALAGPATVIVEGSNLRHALEISIETETPGPAPEAGVDAGEAHPDALLPTATTEGVMVNDLDRLALVALFAG